MGFGVLILFYSLFDQWVMVVDDGGLMMVAGWVDGGCGLIVDGGLGCDGSVRGF